MLYSHIYWLTLARLTSTSQTKHSKPHFYETTEIYSSFLKIHIGKHLFYYSTSSGYFTLKNSLNTFFRKTRQLIKGHHSNQYHTLNFINLFSKKKEVTAVIYKNLWKKTVLIMRSLAHWCSFLINLRPQGKFQKTGAVLMLCPSYSKKTKRDEGGIYCPFVFYQNQMKQRNNS